MIAPMIPSMTIALYGLLVALQLADGVTTHIILKRAGAERNIVMVWAIRTWGVAHALWGKVIIIAVLVWFALPIMPWWVLAGLDAWYVIVVAHNTRELLK